MADTAGCRSFLSVPHMYFCIRPSCPPPPPALPEADLPDELHRLRIHGVWRLGFHWALFHCISTLDEGQGCFGIVQGLPKLLHLTTQTEVSSLIGGFLICCFFFKQEASPYSLYALRNPTFELQNPVKWSWEKKKKERRNSYVALVAIHSSLPMVSGSCGQQGLKMLWGKFQK